MGHMGQDDHQLTFGCGIGGYAPEEEEFANLEDVLITHQHYKTGALPCDVNLPLRLRDVDH